MKIDFENMRDVVDGTSNGIMPLEFISVTVDTSWLDYNGHMNESAYMFVAGLGYEGFAKYIGMDAEWVATKGSFFTLENHNRYFKECNAGDVLVVKTHLVDMDKKRIHLCNMVYKGEDLVFTSEQMKIYVNPTTRCGMEIHMDVYDRVDSLWAVHRMRKNAYIGRIIGMKK